MRNFLILFLVSILVFTCDDGDIITVQLDFQQELLRCDENTDSYVLYEIKTDPVESLSLVIPRNTTTEAYFDTVTDIDNPPTFDVDDSGVSFNYRTYNIEPSFCSAIQDPSVTIFQDYQALGGTVTVTTTFIDTDDDGISNSDEGADPNGDGDFSDSQDTDGDGLYDYIDQDDDNDNILTANEDDNEDGDNNPFTNPRDTDDDGIADYLEEDDDNDGVITRLEDADGNRNPRDDFLLGEPDELPRYRNPDAAQVFPAPTPDEFLVVEYTRTFSTQFTITNLDIEILSTMTLDFGTYVSTPPETIMFDNNSN